MGSVKIQNLSFRKEFQPIRLSEPQRGGTHRSPHQHCACARSTRLNKDDDDNKSRFKTTTCAIHVDEEEAQAAP